MKDWVPVPDGLVAEIVSAYVPPVPATGVPAIVAVPLPLSVNVTPAGRLPVLVIVVAAAGLVVTVKRARAAEVNVAWSALVIAGASVTVRVKDCWLVPAELVAEIVSG